MSFPRIPAPADYPHDDKLDLACSEPAAQRIGVSFGHGATVGLRISVPPHCMPAWVTMY